MSDSPEVRAFHERLSRHFAESGFTGIDPAVLLPIANAEPLSDVDSTLFAVGALRRWLGDREMIGVFKARAEGRSWSWIGERLGKSRQAVWERYSDRLEASPEA